MRSIDLHWLSKKEKDITLPNLVYENIGYGCGGSYYSSTHNDEVYLNGKYYDCSNGLILVNTYNDYSDKNEIENVLAHEWRHHCQYLRNIYTDPYDSSMFDWNDDYWNSIIKFFSTNKTEVDALLFAEKYAPSDCTTEWISHLKDFNVLLNPILNI